MHLKRQTKLFKWTPYLEEKWGELLTEIATTAEWKLSHFDRNCMLGMFTNANIDAWSKEKV